MIATSIFGKRIRGVGHGGPPGAQADPVVKGWLKDPANSGFEIVVSLNTGEQYGMWMRKDHNPELVKITEAGMTMLVVTHEMTFAQEVADRVVFMDGGVVVEEGPPQRVIADPARERTRTFLSRVLDPAAARVPDGE